MSLLCPVQDGTPVNAPMNTTGRNIFRGSAANVVQAHEIQGGVHFHQADPALPVPSQLPPDVTHFTGRGTDLAELDSLLTSDEVHPPSTVIITAIDGTAGVGKTALAVHWAHRRSDRFPDGILYANLQGFDPVNSPDR